MNEITVKDLYAWCSIPYDVLENHEKSRVPFRLCKDSQEMGEIMADELASDIKEAGEHKQEFRVVIPCGPSCWYKPFTDLVNREGISLRHVAMFHMDECLDWQGRELPRTHPYNFRGFMEEHFYDPVDLKLAVPEEKRFWLTPDTMKDVKKEIDSAPIDLTYGGWGQDGHIAYNQTRRHPYSRITIDDLRNSTIRIQDNNLDTILALAQRTFGTAYQFAPPMSVTLGVKECLSAKKIRVFSDTGSWKQTALRVALFGQITTEYPLTLLQEHNDALITATVETAAHPISLHPEWDLGL